jgi:hypothetical protein
VTPNSDKCLENVVLAVNFCQRGPHVFSGFTVGFSPRGKEVVCFSISTLKGLLQSNYIKN